MSIDSALLRKLPLFRELPMDALHSISAILKARRVQEGDILFVEADRGLGVWLVLEGAVKLVKTDSLGREQLLKIVAPEEFFAEVVLFDEGSYPATAIAAKEGRVAILYNADVRQLIDNHPNLAWHFLKILSSRLRKAQDRIRILCTGDVTVKIAATLLFVSREQEADTITLGRQDLADMAGVARETASRVLSSFANDRLIELGRRSVTILHKHKLSAIALQGN